MNDDYPSSNGSEPRSWLERLSQAFSGGEPRNREELLDILTEAHQRDILDADTLSMVEGAFEVSEAQVRDAMIPRGQMVVIPHDAKLEEILPIIVESGHSRFPVVKRDKDEVVGILLAKDLLKFFVDGHEFDLETALRPAVFIPESKRLAVLLKEFRASRNHMAVVVDEYGGVSGLITIEDVLEEIVGEIDDEHDEDEIEYIVPKGSGRFTVNALTPIDVFNAHFDSAFSEEEFDTIGGLVMGQLGRLPEGGEQVTLGDFDFEVLRADNRRLHLLGLRLADN
ncbi:MAG: transporter associated domain-containing protein [Xanthomonadales bacterium]|nr:transporter associated domain-containing protein [Xanthomonadales bacterium]